MSRTIEELKEYILANYDPEDLIDYFQISSEEILDRFEDRMLQYSSIFEEIQELEAEEYDSEH